MFLRKASKTTLTTLGASKANLTASETPALKASLSVKPLTRFKICFYAAIVVSGIGLYFLTLALAAGVGVLVGTGLKHFLFGIAGALTLLGLIQPTLVPRCFFYKGKLTKFARWVMGTFNIAEDQLKSGTSFPWWLSLSLGVLGFVVNLLLRP